jgi:V8-like Glu-specific endopeptidase
MPARGWTILSAGAAMVLLVAGCTSSASHSAPAATSNPTTAAHKSEAVSFDGVPQVGALFAGSSDQGLHFCTASVVHSRRGNVIATAAHCLTGTGTGLVFVPGYHDGSAPDGEWPVKAAYVDPRWLRDQDPMADDAFLTVSPQSRGGRTVEIEQAVGSDPLAVDQPFTTPVTMVAYPGQVGGRPITCSTVTYAYHGYAGFDCGGFVGGTSGSPWLMDYNPTTRRGRLYGVIGGLHEGGCSPDTSYTVHFDASTAELLARAERGGQGDTVPQSSGDGC